VAAWLGASRLWLHATRLELPAVDGRSGRVIESAPGQEWSRLLRDAGA